ncbi:hypothetical protein [Alcanivorax sediminis]|uniref:Uncharacterized protein n=1 Tax=Alcanivorax sediminis TaxID=2663008 RepID=A0A6N7LQA2_9GAMM|nr:hypothetical protein [Alcanivorax sediminis]MQX52283.1 hypothetical protein [Alcanivorax sediminis]
MDFVKVIFVWAVPLLLGLLFQRGLLQNEGFIKRKFWFFAASRAGITATFIAPTLLLGGHGGVPVSFIGGFAMIFFIGPAYTDSGLSWGGVGVRGDAGLFVVLLIPCYVAAVVSLVRSKLKFT